MNDCDMQNFRPSGAGGQHRDKTSNGVRIVHRESGAMGQCSENRSQAANKRVAFLRMAKSEKFETWRRMEAMRLLGRFPESAAEVADRQMDAVNLVVEVRDGGRWITA